MIYIQSIVLALAILSTISFIVKLSSFFITKKSQGFLSPYFVAFFWSLFFLLSNL